MTDTKELKRQMVKLTERVILLQQALNVAMRNEPSGTTTVGNLDNASATQLDDNPLFYIEHADGGLSVYLSQIEEHFKKGLTASDIPDLPATKITSEVFSTDRIPNLAASKINSGTFNADQIPAAVNSATSGSGFGGFRYQLSGTTLNLYTS